MIKNIIVERPVSWINSDITGRYVGILYDHLLNIFKSYNINIEIIDIFYFGCNGLRYDRTPKFNNSDTLYFSYHTYGDIVNNLWRIKESYIPGFFSIDPKGYSGFSKLADMDKNYILKDIKLNIAKKFIYNIYKTIIKKNISKYNQNIFKNNYSIPNNSVFFPLQVQNDTVLDLMSFEFYNLLEHVCKNITYPIIIKIHPYSIDIDYLRKKILDLSLIYPNVILSEESVHQILPKCKCCMTINSGVGFEALLHNKPVITFGKSDYHTVTYNCDKKEMINNNLILNCIKNHNPNNTIKFLYYYLNDYCIYYNNINLLKTRIENILNNNELLFNC